MHSTAARGLAGSQLGEFFWSIFCELFCRYFCTSIMPTMSEEGGGASGTQPLLITVPVNIPLPERMDLSFGNLPGKWQRFCWAWSNYEITAQLKDPENPVRNKERLAATLLTCISSDALDIIDAMEFENEDQRKDAEVILEKMKRHCIGECNETYERFVFNRWVQPRVKWISLCHRIMTISKDMWLWVINRLTYLW